MSPAKGRSSGFAIPQYFLYYWYYGGWPRRAQFGYLCFTKLLIERALRLRPPGTHDHGAVSAPTGFEPTQSAAPGSANNSNPPKAICRPLADTHTVAHGITTRGGICSKSARI